MTGVCGWRLLPLIVLVYVAFEGSAAASSDDAAAWDEQQCVSAIRANLQDFSKLSGAQLRLSFSKVARAQAQGRAAAVSSPADQATVYLLTAIQRCGQQQAEVPCVTDSLPAAPPAERVLLAADIINSAPLMPHFLIQMLLTIVKLAPGAVYVSIYESGSTDATGAPLLCNCALLACMRRRQSLTPAAHGHRHLAAPPGRPPGHAGHAQQHHSRCVEQIQQPFPFCQREPHG